MLTIIADVQITRRKRAHLVVSDEGVTRYAASRLSDCLSWLEEQGHTEVVVTTPDDECYRLVFSRVRPLLDATPATIQD